MEVLCGVPVRRRVAAADVSARQANTQVHPSPPYLEAVFAAPRAWGDLSDLVHVSALRLVHILNLSFHLRWGTGSRRP